MGSLLAALTTTLVFCAPGYPGTAGDAQPLVDAFAQAAASAAQWPGGSLTAVYDPTESGGLGRLQSADAAVAFVPYPFFVEHGASLHLRPLLQADVTGIGTQQRWTLVAQRGHASAPQALAGYVIASTAGYAPAFVRGVALASWPLPADTRISFAGQTLSTLRKVAGGEMMAVLLDQEQTTALSTLPFANQLETLVQSSPVPVALIAVVDPRLAPAQVDSLTKGLLKLAGTSQGVAALAPLRLNGFVAPRLPRASSP
jgi:hypothetical protein